MSVILVFIYQREICSETDINRRYLEASIEKSIFMSKDDFIDGRCSSIIFSPEDGFCSMIRYLSEIYGIDESIASHEVEEKVKIMGIFTCSGFMLWNPNNESVSYTPYIYDDEKNRRSAVNEAFFETLRINGISFFSSSEKDILEDIYTPTIICVYCGSIPGSRRIEEYKTVVLVKIYDM